MITLDFVNTETGEIETITISQSAVTAAIAYYEERGWALL